MVAVAIVLSFGEVNSVFNLLGPGHTIPGLGHYIVIARKSGIIRITGGLCVSAMWLAHSPRLRFEVFGEPVETDHKDENAHDLHVAQDRDDVDDELLIELQFIDINHVQARLGSTTETKEVGVNTTEVAIRGKQY